MLKLVLISLAVITTAAASAVPAESSETIRVVTIVQKPFLEIGEDGGYTGFIPALLDRLAPLTGLAYDVYLVPDGMYGRINEEDGTWAGMVGELVNRSAHMAAAPLTVTPKRDEAIDFSVPFLNVQRGALVREPNVSTWWQVSAGAQPTAAHRTHLEVTVQRCLHLRGLLGTTFPALVHQEGSHFTYLAHGSTENLLRDSSDPMARAAYNKSAGQPHATSFAEGLEAVLSDSMTAFIGEDLFLKYVAQEDCELRFVDDGFSTTHYSLGFPEGSQYKARHDAALLELMERGDIHHLKEEYLIHPPGVAPCRPSHLEHELEHVAMFKRKMMKKYQHVGKGKGKGNGTRSSEWRDAELGVQVTRDSDRRGGVLCQTVAGTSLYEMADMEQETDVIVNTH